MTDNDNDNDDAYQIGEYNDELLNDVNGGDNGNGNNNININDGAQTTEEMYQDFLTQQTNNNNNNDDGDDNGDAHLFQNNNNIDNININNNNIILQPPQQYEDVKDFPKLNQTTQSSSTTLQNQLKFICDKIEEAITQYRQSQQEKNELSHNNNNNRNTYFNPSTYNIIGDGSQKSLKQTLEHYKELSEGIKYKLDKVYNIQRVEAIESDIKKKKEQMQLIMKENRTIAQINENQVKAIDEYQNKFQNKKEKTHYTAQIKKLKDDTKNLKDELKQYEQLIKEQTQKISELEERCVNIKENIEYKKKKQMKEVNEYYEQVGDGLNEEEQLLMGMTIEELEEKKNELENQITFDERQHKIEIATQNEIIQQLQKDITKITLKQKEIEKNKRINELKMKEKKKTNNALANANTNTNTANNTNNMKKRANSRQQQMRKISNHTGYNSSNSNKMVLGRKYDGVNDGSNGVNNRSTNVNGNGNVNGTKTPNFKVKGKLQKPFEINKFNYGNSNSKVSNNNNIPTNSNSNNNDDMINQIELMCADIKNTIINTNLAIEHAKQKDNDIHNNNNNHNLESDLSEIRNEFEPINAFDPDISRISHTNRNTKTATNTKRKPFDNINFK
jgi:hypothetical protein